MVIRQVGRNCTCSWVSPKCQAFWGKTLRAFFWCAESGIYRVLSSMEVLAFSPRGRFQCMKNRFKYGDEYYVCNCIYVFIFISISISNIFPSLLCTRNKGSLQWLFSFFSIDLTIYCPLFPEESKVGNIRVFCHGQDLVLSMLLWKCGL